MRGDLFEVVGGFPRRQVPERTVCQSVIVPLLQALVFLHGNNIIHRRAPDSAYFALLLVTHTHAPQLTPPPAGLPNRDIKPENLVITASGSVKLTDFGLAIDTSRDAPVSRLGTLVRVRFFVPLPLPLVLRTTTSSPPARPADSLQYPCRSRHRAPPERSPPGREQEYMAPEIVRLRKRRPGAEVEALRRRGVPLYDAKVDIWAVACLACAPAPLVPAYFRLCVPSCCVTPVDLPSPGVQPAQVAERRLPPCNRRMPAQAGAQPRAALCPPRCTAQ